MEKNHVLELIPEYLDGVLPVEIQKQVEEHLLKCPKCQKEMEEMKLLFNALDTEVVAVPSDRLKAKFEEALEAEKENMGQVVSLTSRKRSNWASNLLKVAASIALLVAAFQMGSLFQQQKVDENISVLKDETLQMKQTAMLSLMENQSASKRIQGVNYIDEFEHPDEAIIKALANRLLNDENDNVRLTAFEALSKFTSSETVKNVFIDALGQEKNPSIQIGIIEELVKIQEKKAIDPMKKLLDEEETQPFVKEQIKTGLPKII
ncbi:HEAT repeat domain-containing protein [Muricauda sp. CAU 1633]|uniref:HEAT repeat domain-containing protein n=1 Tax=Allomuricauda sp. CAU 1633 TaxID=2816036 RepID=UPI001A8CA9B7|nr:HEAT repeat domain-containing protein [Muricauda sp. CAU 1633]MBO0320756.1 HEAT repeat domain-containing protein [Muricauda sp. CAU 1633]